MTNKHAFALFAILMIAVPAWAGVNDPPDAGVSPKTRTECLQHYFGCAVPQAANVCVSLEAHMDELERVRKERATCPNAWDAARCICPDTDDGGTNAADAGANPAADPPEEDHASVAPMPEGGEADSSPDEVLNGLERRVDRLMRRSLENDPRIREAVRKIAQEETEQLGCYVEKSGKVVLNRQIQICRELAAIDQAAQARDRKNRKDTVKEHERLGKLLKKLHDIVALNRGDISANQGDIERLYCLLGAAKPDGTMPDCAQRPADPTDPPSSQGTEPAPEPTPPPADPRPDPDPGPTPPPEKEPAPESEAGDAVDGNDAPSDKLGPYVDVGLGLSSGYNGGAVDAAGNHFWFMPTRGNIPLVHGPFSGAGELSAELGVEGAHGQGFLFVRGSPGLQFEPVLGGHAPTLGWGARFGAGGGLRWRAIEHDGFSVAIGPHAGAQYRYAGVAYTTSGVNDVYGVLGASAVVRKRFSNGLTVAWKPSIQGGVGGGAVLSGGTHRLHGPVPLIQLNLLNISIGWSGYEPEEGE